MKITIIYGNQREENTYHCVKIIKDTFLVYENVTFTEFFLPRDMPYFCHGCFNCFLTGEQNCPHYEHVQPIVDAILSSDTIILSSPTYGFNVTGSMKALIDHLCYMWISHRPNKKMFSKVAMLVSTTAGMGAGSTIKTMKNTLNFMGTKRIYSYGVAVAATSWQNVKPDKKRKIEQILSKKAKKLYQAVKKRDKLSYRLHTKIFFFIMKRLFSTYNDENFDKRYWQKMGWFEKVKPF